MSPFTCTDVHGCRRACGRCINMNRASTENHEALKTDTKDDKRRPCQCHQSTISRVTNGPLEVVIVDIPAINALRRDGSQPSDRDEQRRRSSANIGVSQTPYLHCRPAFRGCLGKQSNTSAVHLVKTYCLPPLIYGCQTWTLTDGSLHKLNTSWNNCFRRIYLRC